MAELADALDSGSSEGFLHAGSSPVSRTKSEIIRTSFLPETCSDDFLICKMLLSSVWDSWHRCMSGIFRWADKLL